MNTLMLIVLFALVALSNCSPFDEYDYDGYDYAPEPDFDNFDAADFDFYDGPIDDYEIPDPVDDFEVPDPVDDFEVPDPVDDFEIPDPIDEFYGEFSDEFSDESSYFNVEDDSEDFGLDSFKHKKKKGTYRLDRRGSTTQTEKAMFKRWIESRMKKTWPNNYDTKLAWEEAQTVVTMGMYYDMTRDVNMLSKMKKACDDLLDKRERKKLFIEQEEVLTWPTYDRSEKSANGKPIYFMNMKMTSQLLAPFAYFAFLVSESPSNVQNQYKNTALKYLDVVFDRMDWFYKSAWYHSKKDLWVFPDLPNYTKVDQFKGNDDFVNTPLMWNSWFITSGQMEWARRAANNFGVHRSEASKFRNTIQSCLSYFLKSCVYERNKDAYRWVYLEIKGEKKWEDPGHGGIDIFGLVRLYNNGNNPYGLSKTIMQRFANTFKKVMYRGGWKFYCDLGYNKKCGSEGKRPEEKSVGWSPLVVVDGQVMDIMYDNLLGPKEDGMREGPALLMMWGVYYKWIESGGRPLGA